MAEFTTEKRRDLTRSNGLISDSHVEEALGANFDVAYANEVKKDKTNNELFRRFNSELTGLAYEYRYLSGKYHPTLDEIEITYTDLDNSGNDYITKTYWDNLKLQSAANLDAGNEFHLNIREGTTVSYPIRPDKYASWVDDTHEYVSDFETTEDKLISMVRTLDTWYSSGGGSGNVETKISGSYSEIQLGVADDKQIYMPVGYEAYQADPNSGYMSSGYDTTGEIILINSGDLFNFSFGKIVSSKEKPSRILFAPYGKKGTIPDDATVTSTFDSGTQIITFIAVEVIGTLKAYYEMVIHYLDYNPNDEESSNIEALSTINSVIDLIEIWEADSNKILFTTMISLMDAIEAIRTSTVKSNRITYINSYLPTVSNIYEDRFNVIDLRLSKVGGTLKELMTSNRGASIINTVLQEHNNATEWYSEFFVVMRARKDGEYYRRLFVDDFTPSASTIQVDDMCYVLSNNEDVPEIYAKVTHITEGKLIDTVNSEYNTDGTSNIVYISCKKIFFEGVIFNKSYLMSDDLRIIKEI